MRNALVVSEIAFACVLLVGAGLLIRSLIRVLDVDMGFDPAARGDHPRRSRQPLRDARAAERLLRRGAAPGEGDSRASRAPASPTRCRSAAIARGARGAKGVTYERGQVSLRLRARRQRRLSGGDGHPDARRPRHRCRATRSTSEPVMMVNETMARTLWPGQDPLGKYVLGPCAKERRVVGVVGDVRHLALEQESGNEMYLPMRQCGDQSSADLVVRATLPPAQLAGAMRAALQPHRPEPAAATTSGRCSSSSTSRSRRGASSCCCSAASRCSRSILASLGIYGLISYSVNQRTQEIGIRMALGASARDVQTRIVAQTLRLAAMGMALGTAASWALVRARRRPAVRRDAARSRDVRRDGGGADNRGARGRLSAGAPGVAHRSDGGAAVGVTRRVRGVTRHSDEAGVLSPAHRPAGAPGDELRPRPRRGPGS